MPKFVRKLKTFQIIENWSEIGKKCAYNTILRNEAKRAQHKRTKTGRGRDQASQGRQKRRIPQGKHFEHGQKVAEKRIYPLFLPG